MYIITKKPKKCEPKASEIFEKVDIFEQNFIIKEQLRAEGKRKFWKMIPSRPISTIFRSHFRPFPEIFETYVPFFSILVLKSQQLDIIFASFAGQ